MCKILLEELAYNNGLEFIETVRGGNNGYPSGIRGGIVGFNTFEEADDFAKEHGLSLYTFHKRDGWHMYERAGNPYGPMAITSGDYGDDYNHLGVERLEDFFESEVRPLLDCCESLDDLKKVLEETEEVYEKLQEIDETQWVITCQGRYYETIDKEPVEWSHDTHTWVIGVAEI